MKKITLKEKIIFELKNDYVQFIPRKKTKWNWFEFHFINIYVGKDMMAGPAYEFWFYFMGIGFYFRYNTDKAIRLMRKWERDYQKDLKEMMKPTKKKNEKKN